MPAVKRPALPFGRTTTPRLLEQIRIVPFHGVDDASGVDDHGGLSAQIGGVVSAVVPTYRGRRSRLVFHENIGDEFERFPRLRAVERDLAVLVEDLSSEGPEDASGKPLRVRVAGAVTDSRAKDILRRIGHLLGDLAEIFPCIGRIVDARRREDVFAVVTSPCPRPRKEAHRTCLQR